METHCKVDVICVEKHIFAIGSFIWSLSVNPQVKNFAVIYLVDITEVPDFNKMYELYDPCTVMFFFRYAWNKCMYLNNRHLPLF